MTDRLCRYEWVFLLLALLFSFLMGPSAVFSENRVISLQSVVTPAAPGPEEKRLFRIASEHLAGRQARGITLREAVARALESNLTIKNSQLAMEASSRALSEARAIFDPVLDFSVQYNESETFDRSRTGNIYLNHFAPYSEKGGTFEVISPSATKYQVDIIQFLQQFSGYASGEQEIFASEEPDNGPTETMSFNIGITQLLPWGPRFTVTNMTTRQQVYYDSSGHTYDVPWASSLFGGIELPLPFTKRFGPYTTQDAAIKLSKIRKERAFWELKSVIDSILLNTSLAFWDMVSSLENLGTVFDSRDILLKQTKRSQRLFEIQYITRYDLAQIETELSGIETRLEIAGNHVITASDRLALLMDDRPDRFKEIVYIPKGYEKELKKRLLYNPEKAKQEALAKRPDLMTKKHDYRYNKVILKRNRVLTRPDINFQGSYSVSQNASVYGYESYSEAIDNLSDPDSLSKGFVFNFRRSIGNRGEEAALKGAGISLTRSGLAVDEQVIDIEQEVDDAISDVVHSREIIKLTEKDLNLSKLAFIKIEEKFQKGETASMFELLLKRRSLFTARMNLTEAEINNKKAELRLLAAISEISGYFVDAAADSPFEKYRITKLTEESDMQFFRFPLN